MEQKFDEYRACSNRVVRNMTLAKLIEGHKGIRLLIVPDGQVSVSGVCRACSIFGFSRIEVSTTVNGHNKAYAKRKKPRRGGVRNWSEHYICAREPYPY
jgi:hypothetical protein